MLVRMSLGRYALPSGMFSTAGTTQTQIQRKLQLDRSEERAEHAGRAAHVELHLLHARAGLERDAAGVERDALSDKRVRFLFVLAAVPAQHDELRRIRRTLRHAEQRAHAELLHVLALEHFERDAGVLVGDLLRLRGDVGRIADVRRQVAELARETHAVGDRGRFLERPLHCGVVSLRAGEGERVELRRLRFFLRLERRRIAVGLRIGGERRGADLPGGVAAGHVELGQIRDRRFDRQTLEHARGLADGATVRCRVEFLLLAESGEHDARRGDAGEPEQHGDGSGLAGRIAALDQALQRAAGALVDARGGRRQYAVLVKADDDGVGRRGFRRVVGERELQGHFAFQQTSDDRSRRAGTLSLSKCGLAASFESHLGRGMAAPRVTRINDLRRRPVSDPTTDRTGRAMDARSAVLLRPANR